MNLRILAAILIFGLSTGAAFADFAAGLKAFRNSDYKTAYRQWMPMAKAGDAKAQLGVGWLYDAGKGVSQNYDKAAKWYETATKQGNLRAKSNLAALYYLGHGKPVDYGKSMDLFYETGKKGDVISNYMLGMMYQYGPGGTMQVLGFSYFAFRVAAAKGLAEAQYELGYFYEFGTFPPQDFGKAPPSGFRQSHGMVSTLGKTRIPKSPDRHWTAVQF